MRASTASIRDILQRTYAASHEPTLGGISMLKRSLTALFIPALACATVIAQELSPTHLHQPTLTPQNSGTTNGLIRSEEHTSELQSRGHLVCRLLLEKKKIKKN